MEIRRGIAVCPGIAIAPALVLDTEGVRIPNTSVSPEQVEAEVARLRHTVVAALVSAAEQQKALTAKLGHEIGDIFEAKGGLFDDAKLIGGIEGLIRAHDYSAEYAVSRHVRGILKHLDEHAHLPQAARMRGDYIDFERQLLSQLLGDRQEPLSAVAEPVIVLANDLTPSETAQLDPKLVHALATESGGVTSHTAILANALEIPAVVGVGKFLTDVSGGDIVIVDGNQGLLILDPDEATLARYEAARRLELSRSGEHRVTGRNVPAVTRDGVRVYLLGNIEFPGEAAHCLDRGAEGVGLYRTEFLYVQKSADPTEEEHYQAYKAVLQEIGPDKPVVIRTLDLGGDKFNAAVGAVAHEKNPFLGLRSVRLCLRNLPLFKTQLRAILRASVYGDVRVMFPMISTVMELRQCKSILREVQEDLEEARIPFKPDVPIGTMIEVPSAALLADVLAKQVNFFSIGTNDLVQYTLAADRNNELVADLYDAADPAVLRLMDMVSRAGQAAGIEVNVCGEMSGETMFTPLLIGLGIRQFSATPRKIPEIKRAVRNLTVPDCERLVRECLRMETASEITRYLRDYLRRILPDAAD
jgi:phosphoenolpyruvate-protein phosphotransferase (PTS system enzyme I)